MFRITKGTDMGWPYTYWDGVKKVRLQAPDYGGDGKTAPTENYYATPVAAFAPQRPAVLDLAFYSGSKFPAKYRRGAFLAMHGGGADGGVRPGGHAGYNVMFVPFNGSRAGTPEVFADGFAGATARRQAGQDRGLSPGGRGGGPGRGAVCRRFQQGQDLADCLRRIGGSAETGQGRAAKPRGLDRFLGLFRQI